MDLKDVDLNLLLVFHELLIEKRVSAAADKLGLTQPSVSNALSRLRKQFGDNLFVRTSRGMTPTPFAAQLAEPIGTALDTIRASLNQRTAFDPATSTRKFMLGMTDIGEIYFLPKLMEALATMAPGVTISTVRNAAVNLKDEMESGHIDMGIGLLPQLKAGFFQRRLFLQPYVCMFRKGHPLDKGRITQKQFADADHVTVVSAGTGHSRVDGFIEKKGITRRIKLTVPHFVAVGHILSTTDMIATVPERYAMECVKPFGLTYVKHPVAIPEIAINIFWHAKAHKEPGNQWLRGVIFEKFGGKAG
jgi:DNA-binding transcriptional LysR family regulator